MNSINLIVIIALIISLISIGLFFGLNMSLQNEITEINGKLEKQLEYVTLLTTKLDALEEQIRIEHEANSELKLHLNKTDSKIMELNAEIQTHLEHIITLESRLLEVEKNLQKSQLVPPKPIFESETKIDGNGLRWTSHFIQGPPENDVSFEQSCNSFSNQACYVNISELDTPYGKGISVDSIGSSNWSYWFWGLSEEYVVPENGIVTISGKFLKNDTFSPTAAVNRSNFEISILTNEGTEDLKRRWMLTHKDQNSQWHQKEISFDLTPGQIIQIGLGVRDGWQTDFSHYAAWADVVINAEKLS